MPILHARVRRLHWNLVRVAWVITGRICGRSPCRNLSFFGAFVDVRIATTNIALLLMARPKCAINHPRLIAHRLITGTYKGRSNTETPTLERWETCTGSPLPPLGARLTLPENLKRNR